MMIKFSDDNIFDPATMNVVTVYAAPNYPSTTGRIIPYPSHYPTIPKTSNPKIFYLCDGKRCGDENECGNCKHTSDITHAKNFKPITIDCDGSPTEIIYVEQENPSEKENPLMSNYECYDCGEVFSTSNSDPICPACGNKQVYKEDSDETKQDAPS